MIETTSVTHQTKTLQDILQEHARAGTQHINMAIRELQNGQPAFAVRDTHGDWTDFLVVRNDVFTDRSVLKLGSGE